MELTASYNNHSLVGIENFFTNAINEITHFFQLKATESEKQKKVIKKLEILTNILESNCDTILELDKKALLEQEEFFTNDLYKINQFTEELESALESGILSGKLKKAINRFCDIAAELEIVFSQKLSEVYIENRAA